jgi:hypothetical protein
MQFQSKTEQQIQEENLIPVGDYDFTVQKAEEKKSKAGNDMIVIDMDIYVGDKARPFKDYLMESMAYKLRHFCYAVGLGAKYDAGTLTAQDCIGKSGKVKMAQKQNGDYGLQNNVKDYIVGEAKSEPAHTPAPSRPTRPAPAPEDDPNSPPF